MMERGEMNEEEESVEEKDKERGGEGAKRGETIKIGKKYTLKSKEDKQERKVKILSRAGKAQSKKWGRSYNVEDMETEEVYWLSGK